MNIKETKGNPLSVGNLVSDLHDAITGTFMCVPVPIDDGGGSGHGSGGEFWWEFSEFWKEIQRGRVNP